jgi:hypothetical protein
MLAIAGTSATEGCLLQHLVYSKCPDVCRRNVCNREDACSSMGASKRRDVWNRKDACSLLALVNEDRSGTGRILATVWALVNE